MPKGSILGTLLFLVHLNDFAVDSNQIILYADDATLCYEAEAILILNRKMTAEHKVVSQWFIDNGLHENAGNITEIVFTNKRNKITSQFDIWV